MSSTAETPSIEQKGSCRCSREPPWKISKECSEFKSRTPRFAPRLAESVAFRAATRPLTGQQCCEIAEHKLSRVSITQGEYQMPSFLEQRTTRQASELKGPRVYSTDLLPSLF